MKRKIIYHDIYSETIYIVYRISNNPYGIHQTCIINSIIWDMVYPYQVLQEFIHFLRPLAVKFGKLLLYCIAWGGGRRHCVVEDCWRNWIELEDEM